MPKRAFQPKSMTWIEVTTATDRPLVAAAAGVYQPLPEAVLFISESLWDRPHSPTWFGPRLKALKDTGALVNILILPEVLYTEIAAGVRGLAQEALGGEAVLPVECFNDWGGRRYDDSVPGEVTKTTPSRDRTT